MQSLRSLGAEVIGTGEPGDGRGVFWRFEAASAPEVEVMLSRDCDSRLSPREAAAVAEWLASPAQFHIMRDHPGHDVPILGGMWGVKAPLLCDMAALIGRYAKGNFWQADQNFLREVVYPVVKSEALVHDEFIERRPFPTRRRGLSHARNRGYREARCEHVAYLDDDARAFPDFVERVLEVAQGRAFACWGGIVLNEYETPRPAWLSERFRSNAHLFAHHAEMLRLRPGESVWGSVMVFERRVLELLNGFDSEYGMRGDRRRYGEETELQDRLRAAGYAIGVDPRLRIHHLVPPQAYRLGWHWKDIYGSGL